MREIVFITFSALVPETTARDCKPYRALIFCNHLPEPMLPCAVLSRRAGTAFRTIRNPCLCSPRGIWRGSDLNAGYGGTARTSIPRCMELSVLFDRLRDVESIEIHHLVPSDDKVVNELLLRIGTGVDFSQCAELRV